MAIDSEVKRKSIAAIGQRQAGVVIVPSGSFDQADRQAIGYSYSGILAGGAVAGNATQLINNLPLTSVVDGVLVR